MFEQTMIDTLIVIGTFVLRVGIPLALVLVVGGWLQKKIAPSEEIRETGHRAEGARIIPFTARQNTATQVPTAAQDKSAKRANVK
jgi:hypothetical protein